MPSMTMSIFTGVVAAAAAWGAAADGGIGGISDTALPTETISWAAVESPPNDGQCCVGTCSAANTNKYFSIAHDSGVWLCGETCIRDFFYPIFHIFEKNLTKATDQYVCKDAGYTKYKSTVTHGGGGLECTLDLYECTKEEGCEHPDTSSEPILA